MDTTPLPNQDNDPSDSDSYVSECDNLNHYCVRLTAYEKFTFEELKDFIQAEFQITRYVIGRETDTGNEHFHLVIASELDIQGIKDIIRAFIVPLWTDPDTGKCPRGFGNKQYNIQETKELDRAVSYAVKLSEYVYDGWPEAYIELCRAESFTKKKPSNFKAEYQDLCQRFKESDMDVREFMVDFVLLKAKYGQQVQLHHAYGYAISNVVARDPSAAEEYVENFLYKQ